MATQTQIRHLGDTRPSIPAALQRQDGTAIDLTGLTVKFKMIDSRGGAKVAETADNVTVTDASAGSVQYDPQAADVDTAGTYYGYFIIYDGSDYEHVPVECGDFIISIAADV